MNYTKISTPIIINAASRYCAYFDHYLTSFDDLVSEGNLVVVELLLDIEAGKYIEEDFIPILSRALSLRFIELIRSATCPSRDQNREMCYSSLWQPEIDEYKIDLSTSFAYMGQTSFDDMYVEYKIEHAREMLSSDAYRVFHELLCPSPEVWDAAMRLYTRGLHLVRCGVLRRARKFEITKQAIAEALGLRFSEVVDCYGEVRRYLYEGEAIGEGVG